MKPVHIITALTGFTLFTFTHARVGFFWHITDFHYDPLYVAHGDIKRNCRRTDERLKHHRAAGPFGDYSCDSPLSLIESASLHMRTKHAESVEFVLWTGDIVSSHIEGEEERLQAVRNMTDLLSRTFSSQFVFPVFGHLDPSPSDTLNALWMHWLPSDALNTSKNGGYYTIEQSHTKLRIIALNTNLMTSRNQHNALARMQWEWLEVILEKAARMKEMVYIVGHTPPGSDERHGATDHSYSPDSNRRYIRLMKKFFRIIAGQFFGHLHSDTFRVLYDEADKPISWAMLAPALTPYRHTAGSNNPALRLYKFDTNNGKVLDYTQYYLDLSEANKGEVMWSVEYNLTQYYGLHDVTAQTLHNLAEKFRQNGGGGHESHHFNRYIRANTVRLHDSVSDACDSACVHAHYCAITRIDYAQHRRCVESAASALSSSACVESLRFLHLLIIISSFVTIGNAFVK